MTMHVCKSKRMNYEELLDMLSDKLEQDIRQVYFCSPRVSIQKGLTLVEGDNDLGKMYDMAASLSLIDLYVSHIPQNLSQFYYSNMTFDAADVKIKLNLAKHENALQVAMSNSRPALIAWENQALSTPPRRTPPSPPRTKGRQFQCKNLFKEFLHSDYIDDDFYFSDEDYMPGVPGVDVPAMDVGWSSG